MIYLCVTQKCAKIISKCFRVHGFRDCKGVWHRSRLLVISYKSDIWNETHKKTDSGTAKSLQQLSNPGTWCLLNFPEHSLKNCAWHDIMYAKKGNHLVNKLHCGLVYKPHSSITVVTTELLQSAVERGLNAPQSARLYLWQGLNRGWHSASSFILFLTLQNPRFHCIYKSPAIMTHWNRRKKILTLERLMLWHLSAFAKPETTAQSHSSQWGLTQIPNDNSADI